MYIRRLNVSMSIKVALIIIVIEISSEVRVFNEGIWRDYDVCYSISTKLVASEWRQHQRIYVIQSFTTHYIRSRSSLFSFPSQPLLRLQLACPRPHKLPNSCHELRLVPDYIISSEHAIMIIKSISNKRRVSHSEEPKLQGICTIETEAWYEWKYAWLSTRGL